MRPQTSSYLYKSMLYLYAGTGKFSGKFVKVFEYKLNDTSTGIYHNEVKVVNL